MENLMTEKRIITWFSFLIVFLAFCLGILWIIDMRISNVEAQCLAYDLCAGANCCSNAGQSTISSVKVADARIVQLCYNN
jgi:hypothetical protein